MDCSWREQNQKIQQLFRRDKMEDSKPKTYGQMCLREAPIEQKTYGRLTDRLPSVSLQPMLISVFNLTGKRSATWLKLIFLCTYCTEIVRTLGRNFSFPITNSLDNIAGAHFGRGQQSTYPNHTVPQKSLLGLKTNKIPRNVDYFSFHCGSCN